MISYVTVNDSDDAVYENVARREDVLNIAVDGHYMIGAVLDDGESVGCIGFTVDQGLHDDSPYICIDWIYIDEEYRGNGYGVGLLDEVKKLSQKSGLNDLRVEIPYPDIFDDLTGFFEKEDFSFIYTDSYDFRTTLGELNNTKYANAKIPKLPVVPLSKVPTLVYNEGIRKLSKAQLGSDANKIPLAKNEYDPDLSMAYIDNGELKGVYLVKQMPSGVIESGYMFCVNKNIQIISINLAFKFLKTAVIKCGDETVFHLKAQRTSAQKLMEVLVPEWQGEVIRIGYYE